MYYENTTQIFKQFFQNQKVINSIGGNTQAWLIEQDEGIAHRDQYLCESCKCFIYENEWNEIKKLCCNCAEEE